MYHCAVQRFSHNLLEILTVPSLIHLEVYIVDANDDPYGLLDHINGTGDKIVSQILFKLANGACNNLKDLQIWTAAGVDLRDDHSTHLSEAITACPKLEFVDLSLDGLDRNCQWNIQPLIASIQDLPLLYHLAIIFVDNFVSLGSISSNKDSFHNLEVLHTDSAKIFSHIIQPPKIQPLLIELDLAETLDRDEARSMLIRLSEVAPNLVRITLNLSDYSEPVPEDLRYQWEDLYEPLLKFRDLEILTVGLEEYALGLGDAQIKMMAESWPKLRSLRLDARDEYCDPSPAGRVTLGILDCLAHHCPDPRRLSLCVRASPAFQAEPSSYRQHHFVRQVRLTLADPNTLRLDRGDPETVATHINRLWPSDEITLQCPVGDPELCRRIKRELSVLRGEGYTEIEDMGSDDDLGDWESFKQFSDVGDDDDGNEENGVTGGSDDEGLS